MTDFTDQVKLSCTAPSLTNEQIMKSLLVSAGGSGYTSAPSVTITGGGGSGAAATALITGPITGIPITNGGSGYTSAAVQFSGGGGSDAAATPIISNGQIIAIRIDSGGQGYTSPPTVTITGNGSGATAQATMSVQGITVTNQGSGYTSDPTVTISVPTGPEHARNTATAYAKARPDGKVDVVLGTFPKGASYLTFDSSGNAADAFEVITSDGNPMVTTNKGTIIEKDLMVGGFVDSGQGALLLNYGLVGKPTLSSPPCIELMDSGTAYPSGSTLPSNPEKGQLFNHNGTKKMWDGSNWITGDFSGSYDTLFLVKNDGYSPAHLDLGDLTAHGNITVQKDNPRLVLNTTGSGNPEILLEDAKLYRSAPGGSHFVMEKPLVVEQSLWCYDLASDNFGFGHDGNLSMGNGIQFASAINFWRDLSNNFNMDSHLLLKKSDVKLALISPDFTDVGIEFAPNNTWKMKIGYSVAGDFIYFWNFPASATKLYIYASGDVVSEGTGFGRGINPYGLGIFAGLSANTDWCFAYSKVSGESYPRFRIWSTGELQFGGGSAEIDHKIYRSTAGGSHLRVEGSGGLVVEQSLWCNALASTHFGIDNGGMFFTDSTHLKTTQADYVFDKYSASGSFHWRRCIGGDIGNWVQLMRLDNSGILYLGDTNNLWLQNDGDYLRVGTPSGKGLIINYQLAVGQYSSGATAAYFDGNHLIGTYSSALKYKENITDLTDTEWLYKLRPVEFDWKDPKRKGEGRQYGLIAEEVAEVYPQLVFYNDKGEIEGVRFESLGIPIIVELKKLRNRVAYLEEKLGIYNGKKIY